DAGQISLGINSAVDATGAAFENLELGGAASVQVTDTLDEVVAKLTATPSVTEGGEITYTITLTNKDGLPINNHSALTFTLSDGKTVITVPANGKVNHLYYGSGHLHQLNLDGQVISDMERDDLHREVYRTQGKLTSCFGYDAMGRKAWQFASTLPADKLSQVHNTGINTSLLVEHTYNPIHRRYQYDP
ncbi:hypothetical protein OO307_27715, partial [Pseudomonas sp. DCB_E]|uniref:immunoglobulin-like domain-containing protein n=1 Tax=Pseudomonas sp. DCB_E TaxID=2993591 RepID=UPI002B05EBFC